MKGYWLGALLAATCVFSACTSNDDANEENIVSSNYIVVTSKATMSGNALTTTLEVTANCHWRLSYDKGSWNDLNVSPAEGNSGKATVVVETSTNNTESDRFVTLTFTNDDGTITRTCQLTQSAGDFEATLAIESVENNTLSVPYDGIENKEISIASNTKWQAELDFGDDADAKKNPWCSLRNEEGNGNDKFSVVVSENKTNIQRTATVKVTTQNKSGQAVSQSMVIEQSAAPLPSATIKASRADDGVTIKISGTVSSGSKYELIDYGYCISRETPNPREHNSMISGASSTDGKFSTTTKEEDGYTYYVCAYATTVVGTTYSEDVAVKLVGDTPENDDNTSPNLARRK